MIRITSVPANDRGGLPRTVAPQLHDNLPASLLRVKLLLVDIMWQRMSFEQTRRLALSSDSRDQDNVFKV